MRAQHALVDPVLTHGLPAGPTAHSGIDALAQAIGGCTVRNSSPLSLAFGLEACRHVAQSLARAVGRRHGRGRAPAARVRQPHRRPRDEPLRLRRRSRARPGARERRAPPARAHDRARRRGDARALAARLRRRGSSASADALGEPADGSADGSRAVRAVRRAPRRGRRSRRCARPGSTGSAVAEARRANVRRAVVQPRDRLSRVDDRRGRAGLSRGALPRGALTIPGPALRYDSRRRGIPSSRAPRSTRQAERHRDACACTAYEQGWRI